MPTYRTFFRNAKNVLPGARHFCNKNFLLTFCSSYIIILCLLSFFWYIKINIFFRMNPCIHNDLIHVVFGNGNGLYHKKRNLAGSIHNAAVYPVEFFSLCHPYRIPCSCFRKDFHGLKCRREFDSLGSPNASQSLIRLYFFCQFLILYFHVMPSYVIITMR